MNEGSWPGQTKNNPFLSRVMKTEVGLEPPERQIGQVAHDFQMACGTLIGALVGFVESVSVAQSLAVFALVVVIGGLLSWLAGRQAGSDTKLLRSA